MNICISGLSIMFLDSVWEKYRQSFEFILIELFTFLETLYSTISINSSLLMRHQTLLSIGKSRYALKMRDKLNGQASA